jgi:putative Holliday junction resolvase
MKSFLAVDYGDRRIGLAHGDELGFAFPAPPAVEPDADARLQHVADEVRRRRVTDLIIGYPLNMDGTAGPRTVVTDEFIERLVPLLPAGVEIHRVDEGLSTVEADALAAGDVAGRHGGKHATGKHGAGKHGAGGKRNRPRSIEQRRRQRATGETDSRAAAVILQDFLNAHGYAL